MRYMKEVLRNNKKWVIVYLLIGLFNAFMSNYKADYFQKVIDGLTDRTITIYGILFYGAILFINYGINYIDEYPSAKLGNEIYLSYSGIPFTCTLNFQKYFRNWLNRVGKYLSMVSV